MPRDDSESGRPRSGPDDSGAGYELAPRPEPPALPGSVVLRPSHDDVIDAICADLTAQAIACVREFGDFHLAVSGDPLLERVYLRLMYDPGCRALPWGRTHLWLTHERAVGPEDEQSVYRQIQEILVDHSGIPPRQAHPIDARASDAAERYEQALRETLVWREKGHDRLDYALLVLREDGGLSGLAPGVSAGAAGRDVFVERVESKGEPGVVMTPAFLSGTRFLSVLATGAERRGAIARVLQESQDSASTVPAASLRPLEGVMRWYVDEAALPTE